MSTSVVVGCDSQEFLLIGSESPGDAALQNLAYCEEATVIFTGVNGDVGVSVDQLD